MTLDVFPVRVQIAGIRTVEEATLVEWAGADTIGLLVGQKHESNDFISIEAARNICQQLNPRTTPVWITHIEDVQEIISLASQIPCPVIQLHSDLTADQLSQLRTRLAPRKIIGKVSVEDSTSIHRALAIGSQIDAIILDSIDRSNNKVGGTGKTHDWSLSSQIAGQVRVPVLLAGGLTPENVENAIRTVKPWGVDVNSGVKTSAGQLDEVRLKTFIRRAKNALKI